MTGLTEQWEAALDDRIAMCPASWYVCSAIFCGIVPCADASLRVVAPVPVQAIAHFVRMARDPCQMPGGIVGKAATLPCTQPQCQHAGERVKRPAQRGNFHCASLESSARRWAVFSSPNARTASARMTSSSLRPASVRLATKP